MTLKEIQSKLLQWETSENPLAPLTPDQREAILDLESLIHGVSSDVEDDTSKVSPNEQTDKSLMPPVDNTYDFLDWYDSLSDSTVKAADAPYEAYHKQLEDRRNECVALNDQINATLSDLTKLSEQYNFVSNKTNALHTMSEQLLADQNKLSAIGEEVRSRLAMFSQVEQLAQRLASPALSVNSEQFFSLLARADAGRRYMQDHSSFREASAFLVRYRHVQARARSLLRSYVTHVLDGACAGAGEPAGAGAGAGEPGHAADTAYAVYFGKFQAAAPKLTMVIQEVQQRADTDAEYAALLLDLQREYVSRRARAGPGAGPGAGGAGEQCALVRAACAQLAHVSRDECALYRHVFAAPPEDSPPLQEYLGAVCGAAYERLRPAVLRTDHLETLAELAAILRQEVLQQAQADPAALGALGGAARALLHDVQERLVFRAHVHLRRDVRHYRPAPGDLAYPDKLHMMEQIALSLQQEAPGPARSPAGSEPERRAAASPADLHGMWYPAVRRTLAALSRLYRCVERRVFQGLAQEAVACCVDSVAAAAELVAARATPLDGDLFEIKHILILREQIAPFQVDFVIKETSLDFTNMKNAAYGIIQKPRQLFSLNSNNSLLEFLSEGAPQVRELVLDSRRAADRRLRACCARFLARATRVLAAAVQDFLHKAQTVEPSQLRSQPWASPAHVGAAVQASLRDVRTHLAPLQRSMRLYLANKETEFILCRPIRNNVVGLFVQLSQLLAAAGYSEEDLLIVACPTPEQVSVFISSASLISHSEPVQPYGVKTPLPSVVRKPSVSQPLDTQNTLDVTQVQDIQEKPDATQAADTQILIQDTEKQSGMIDVEDNANAIEQQSTEDNSRTQVQDISEKPAEETERVTM